MITVITVTFNSAHTIRRLIESLRSQLSDRISELLVIDNLSTDDTRAIVTRAKLEWPVIKLIENGENTGYRRAINQAVELSSNEVLFVVNPDAWLVDRSVTHCLEACERDRDCGYISPLVVVPKGEGSPSIESTVLVPFLYRSAERFDQSLLAKTVEVGAGGAFVTRRSHFLGVGGYDEGIFMYSEEEEICSRFRDRGVRVEVIPGAHVYHDQGHSVRSISSGNEFLFTRLLENARYLYFGRSFDITARRVLWSAFFLLRATEFSLALRRASPLRVALSSWKTPPRPSERTPLIHVRWHLTLWFGAYLRELRNRFGSGREMIGKRT